MRKGDYQRLVLVRSYNNSRENRGACSARSDPNWVRRLAGVIIIKKVR